ncbi:acetate--CoA ligase [Microvirga guangxiensis]|uniref:Acetyl-coenzyme A synthetase n=1 Tax=Microvirga guangxiensis TaxID=549386 RepID=A0A1G5I255_9HYPH|nr:acetate--CoA ligase [Microvirga guangxiensis]SCY69981.1 acetyl-coenzyme A synthetase [Microvirga guangxiensis]
MTQTVFPVPASLEASAHVNAETYEALYRQSIDDPETFWREQAQILDWARPFTQVKNTRYSPDDVTIEWFADGRLNASYNCLDRHAAVRGNEAAILWEGDTPGETKRITWSELHSEVSRLANALKKLGVKKGDFVSIYLPVIHQSIAAMLACVRIGAVHSVVFSGFSSEALAGRIEDCRSRVLITADEGMRGGRYVPLKKNADAALEGLPFVEHVLVVRRTGRDVPMKTGRDRWYDEALAEVPDTCEPVDVSAEDPLFVLYTSGSTGKPKGMLHTTGGYLVHAAASFKAMFDYHPGDIHFCTADVGWVTAHTYLIYGPLANGATIVLFEGVPTWPDASRWWQIVETYKVNIFYTAPTAVRSLMREGEEPVRKHDLSSLKVLGSVGEPINPEAWLWYHEVIGGGRCPIVDTYWQTETGAVLLCPLPGAMAQKPGSAARPFFGVRPELLSSDGTPVEGEGSGSLCFADSWPGQARTILGDRERFLKTYFSAYPGFYFTGDGARRDADGYYWITGRLDDVINVSGHRLGTVEVEAALASHPAVAEAAVVGFPHEIKGQGIFAFVTLKEGMAESHDLQSDLVRIVRARIGPIATPDRIEWASQLPKNRSGKILRRILTRIAAGDFENHGDTSTVADPAVVADIVRRIQLQPA